MIETASNKLVELPYPPKAVGRGVIVKATEKFCKSKTDGGISLPQSSAGTGTKYDIGEVVSVGKDVVEVRPGDIVVYQIAGSFSFPNGINPSVYFKVEETGTSIMGYIREGEEPKPEPQQLNG